MRVLVAARSVDPDGTSEGICSSKFLIALLKGGHTVTCVTSDRRAMGSNPPRLPWLEGIEVSPVPVEAPQGLWSIAQWAVDAAASRGRPGAFVAQRCNNLLARVTGYPARYWTSVRNWAATLEEQIQNKRPSVVFIRGAGTSFEPHMAMLRLQPTVPWIANYHDPFPISLYPDPYRGRRIAFLSLKQEALHRRIVMAATALTFPSTRLLEWVLRDDLEACRKKAFVLPHVASEIVTTEPHPTDSNLPHLRPDEFNLIHTGTLIANRGAEVLIDAFTQFIDEAPQERTNARLILVGGVHRSHTKSPAWKKAVSHPKIKISANRVSYASALCLAKQSTAMVVIEAGSDESPFFPGKLTDCLMLAKPILAVTPQKSVVRDVLGPNYPLLVAPNDVDGLVAALRSLYLSWRQKQLHQCLPPASLAQIISDEATAQQFDKIASWCMSRN